MLLRRISNPPTQIAVPADFKSADTAQWGIELKKHRLASSKAVLFRENIK